VMGVREDRSLRNAAHLGMAMQLTNICRDVAEDWRRGRLYVPRELLGLEARPTPGGAVPPALRPGFARALPELLARAEALYRSGDEGLAALSYRSAVAIRTARLVYAEIGRRIAARDHDVTAGRAVVPLRRKLALAARALGGVSWRRLRSALDGRDRRPLLPPRLVIGDPDDLRLR
jgi:15-cis-phytoene synthase